MLKNRGCGEPRRDERRASRDERDEGVMTGAAGGINFFRLPRLARAVLAVAMFGALVDTLNVFTAIHDAAEHGQLLPLWKPATWESTSLIAMLLACGIVYRAIVAAPPGRTGWPKFITVHAAGTLGFSTVHILLMNAMRVGLYAAAGHHYPFGESGFLYEYRKDVIGYVIIAAIFWFFIGKPDGKPAAPSARRMFDIRDGRRLLRVYVDEIAAIHAAGNYVEFVLADGRKPLARGSLTDVHRHLGMAQFVRTHRSWAVNMGHVREVRPLGGGDFEIRLEGGLTVPVSRRFSEALDRFRLMVTGSNDVVA